MGFIPERLKEIRLLRGYTLEYVAKEVGVSKQVVSKYEAGKTIPATDTLGKILDLYGISPEYLTNQRNLPNDRSIVFYRARKRTALKTKEVAEVYLKWFYEIIVVINGIYALKECDLPQIPTQLSISAKAELLRQVWNLGEEPINDIVSLLEEHGFNIITVDWDKEKIDGFSQMIGSRPVIMIDGKRGTKQRRQFSIAHELGHLILHREMKEMTDEMEDEADEFAGCFLMPERMIRRDMIRNNADFFVELSKKWLVSPQALVERCWNLGLLGRDIDENDAKRHSLYQKLARKGIEETDSIICTIGEALEYIEVDAERARRFLRELCLPVKELPKLCGMIEGLIQYNQSDDRGEQYESSNFSRRIRNQNK